MLHLDLSYGEARPCRAHLQRTSLNELDALTLEGMSGWAAFLQVKVSRSWRMYYVASKNEEAKEQDTGCSRKV